MTTILIRDATVLTFTDAGVLHRHDILISDSRIEKILPTGSNLFADQVIEANQKIVMPGLVNAHMHFYSSFARGLSKISPSANFLEVLKNLWWRLDKQLSLEDCHFSALVACMEAVKKGTTTLVDHHASPMTISGSLRQIARAVETSGLRASLCYEVSDRDGAEVSEKGLEENKEFISSCKKGGRVQGLFGLHAAFTLENETLKKASEIAKKLDCGFHIHVAEDLLDQNFSLENHKKRVIERLFEFEILKPSTICSHCVHIHETERDLLAKTNTLVVHNPQSNMNNAVGVCDIFSLLNQGIVVGLGTDAMTVNMLEELRASIFTHKLNQKNPSAAFMECVSLLINGNREISRRLFSEDLMCLKEGGAADVILFDYDPFTPIENDNVAGHLVFGLSQSRVRTTIANGKILMKDFELQGIDEKAVHAQARVLAKQLWKRFESCRF